MNIISQLPVINLMYSALITITGYVTANLASRQLAKLLAKKLSAHQVMIIRRSSFYLIMLVFLAVSLQQLGFELGVLLGAAGIFTVALSFAAQTSIANLISGVFLLIEHPFKVGDIIELKGFKGTVESIDLLSTKLRTANNTLVRIPNENIIKAEVINLSFFTTRRLDLTISVDYKTNLAEAKALLLKLTTECKGILKDPAASVNFIDFADSAIDLRFSVWVATNNYGLVKNELQTLIKTSFEQHEIDIPYPQLTIHRAH